MKLFAITWSTPDCCYHLNRRGTWTHPSEGLDPILFASYRLAEEWMVDHNLTVGDITKNYGPRLNP